jgi:hypothetical protein
MDMVMGKSIRDKPGVQKPSRKPGKTGNRGQENREDIIR